MENTPFRKGGDPMHIGAGDFLSALLTTDS